MTILDCLKGKKLGEKLLDPVLDAIDDEFGNGSNKNYELIIDHNEGEVLVKIPSLKKHDEFEFKKLEEYSYPLIMCMNIDKQYTTQHYDYILKKFLELYKKDLEELSNDVSMIEELKLKVKALKKKIENISYISIAGIIFLSVLLILRNNMATGSKVIVAASTILLFVISIYEQLTKDKQVKSLIDGYITVIKTEWYSKNIRKQYVFLCNIME